MTKLETPTQAKATVPTKQPSQTWYSAELGEALERLRAEQAAIDRRRAEELARRQPLADRD
jgi:hypothetical protein